ncbi:TPA: hypothetical protein DIS55_02135, partial [Candidatus Kaiserbacteria bacterium]|nr:hypothetical protein [Candidatus Kaiserbacteria bacterium]
MALPRKEEGAFAALCWLMVKKNKKKTRKKTSRKTVKRIKHAVKNKKSALKKKNKSARVKKSTKKKKIKKLRPVTRGKRAKGGRGKQDTKVEALITLGRERGYVTYDEILREFPTIEDNVLLLEEMYERFSTAGIDILEGGGMLEDTS